LIIVVIRPQTEKVGADSRNTTVLMIKEASIKPNIARKIVESIRLVVHTHESAFSTPYAIIMKIDENTNQRIVDMVYPK
jgi:hypothetical protein